MLQGNVEALNGECVKRWRRGIKMLNDDRKATNGHWEVFKAVKRR